VAVLKASALDFACVFYILKRIFVASRVR